MYSPYRYIKEEDNFNLVQACKDGCLDEVERLLPITDPKTQDCAPLQWAAWRGVLEIVQRLLPLSTPIPRQCAGLQMAVAQGHIEIVKLLMAVDDPKKLNSEPLQIAVYNNNLDMMELLIPVSDHQAALRSIRHKNTQMLRPTDTTVFEQCIEEYEIRQQRKRLNQALKQPKVSHVRKM